MKRKNKFTAVECTLVVLCFVLLTSILVPVALTYNTELNGTYCMKNINLLHTSLETYANDHNDFYTNHDNSRQSSNWQRSIIKAKSYYPGNLKLIECPEDNFKRPPQSDDSQFDFDSEHHWSYVVNLSIATRQSKSVFEYNRNELIKLNNKVFYHEGVESTAGLRSDKIGPVNDLENPVYNRHDFKSSYMFFDGSVKQLMPEELGENQFY